MPFCTLFFIRFDVWLICEPVCSLWRRHILFSKMSLIARFMGQHGAHLGPTGPRWAPCWPHELCYLGSTKSSSINFTLQWCHMGVKTPRSSNLVVYSIACSLQKEGDYLYPHYWPFMWGVDQCPVDSLFIIPITWEETLYWTVITYRPHQGFDKKHTCHIPHKLLH